MEDYSCCLNSIISKTPATHMYKHTRLSPHPRDPLYIIPLQAKLLSRMLRRPQASPPSHVYKYLKRRLSLSTLTTHIILFTFTHTPYTIILVHKYQTVCPTQLRMRHSVGRGGRGIDGEVGQGGRDRGEYWRKIQRRRKRRRCSKEQEKDKDEDKENWKRCGKEEEEEKCCTIRKIGKGEKEEVVDVEDKKEKKQNKIMRMKGEVEER